MFVVCGFWVFRVQRGRLCNSIASEDGFVFDETPPLSNALRVVLTPDEPVSFESHPPVRSHHQGYDDVIYASWAPFYDPHTNVTDLRVGLGTAEFGTDVHEFAVVPVNTTSYSFGPKAGDANFIHGQVYYVVWYTSNPAGAATFYRTAPLYVDVTPPQFQWAVDVFPFELAGVESYYNIDDNVGDVDLTDGTTVRAKFRCEDLESVEGGLRGNISYSWRVCNTADCDDVVYTDWMDAGFAPRGTSAPDIFDDARAAGTLEWVFVQVNCTNPVGLSTLGSSNGMLFDDTPPDNSTAVVVEFDPRPGFSRDLLTGDEDYLSTETVLVAWSGFVTEIGRPPVLDYQVAIGSAPGLDDVLAFTSVGLSTQMETDANVTALVHGSRYYATVRAITTAGASSTVITDGVLFDRHAPEPIVIDLDLDDLALDNPVRCASHLDCMDVSAPGEDVDYRASVLGLSILNPSTVHIAPIALLEYGVSTCDPVTLLDLNLLPMQTSPSPTQQRFDHDDVFMFHGQHYCSVVFSTAASSLVGYNASDGFVVDITPPVPHLVNEGNSAEVDDDAIVSTTAVTITASCSDPESGIHHVEYRVTHVDFESGDVLGVAHQWVVIPDTFAPPSTTPTITTATVSGMDMLHAHWYVSSVRCVNGAGAYADLDSDGYVVDTTAPSSTYATIRHQEHDVEVSVQPHANVIAASWYGFMELESRVASFAWAIGTTPHASDVMNVTNVGPLTSASTEVALMDGTTYYVTVYATNLAGLVSSSSSAGVTVDSSAPLAPSQVNVHLDDDEALPGWLGSTYRIDVSWADAVEPHSDVTYRWALGTTHHGQQVLPWTPVGAATSDFAIGLSLVPGMPYYVSVEVTNDMGLQSVALSSLIRVDPYAPAPGTVADGLSTVSPRRSQREDWKLDCAWAAFIDPQSGIDSYRVGWGTTRGTADFVSFIPVGANVSTYTQAGVSLQQGTMYYCTVLAYDMAGNMVSASSQGVMIDTTPVVQGSVFDIDPELPGGSGAVDIDSTSNPSTLKISWPGWHDHESGVTRVEWALGTTAGDTDISGHWTHVRSHTTTATFTSPEPLASGTMIYATVRMWNGVGMTTEASSDGIVVVPGADEYLALPATAVVLHIPAHEASRDAGESWCACGDPAGDAEASGAAYDPVTGACSCGPHTYLDAATGMCTACPAGTCKPGFGNAAAGCTADACTSGQPDATAAVRPPARDALPTCGPAPSASEAAAGIVQRVTRPSDSACVCPAGSRSDALSGLCMLCGAGTVNPFVADVAECGVCWAADAPDTVLEVSWNATALIADGLAPTTYVVSVGTSAGALRWVRNVTSSRSWMQFHSRSPHDVSSGGGPPPLRHGGQLYVRVRAMVNELVVADTRVKAPVVDYSPPVPGGVTDGPSYGIVDATVVPTGDVVAAAWHSFVDPEGSRYVSGLADGIARYEVAFGTSGAWSTDLSSGWLDVGDANHTALDVPGGLADGTVVHASVRAFNAYGAWSAATSNGATVQATVPDGVAVIVPAASVDGAAGEASYRHFPSQAVTDTIAATWQFSQSSPPVPLTYTWYAAEWPSNVSITAPEATGEWTWGVAQLQTPLVPGKSYAVHVTARNAAGVTRTVVSAPVLIDLTPPVTASVNITRPPTAADATYASTSISYQAEADFLGVAWECYDNEATPSLVTVAVGSAVGGDQGMASTNMPYGTLGAELTGLELVHGHCYRAQVACTTDARLRSDFVASAPVCIDTTPPRAGITVMHPVLLVDDAADGSANASAATAVYGDMTAADIVTVASQGGAVAGHIAVAAPFLVEVVRASPVVAVPTGLDLLAAVPVSAGDSESGLTHVEVMWSASSGDASEAEGEAVVGWTPVPLDEIDLLGSGVVSGGVTIADMGSDGGTVYGHWRAFNGAGESSHAVAASPLVLDATPPAAQNATGGPGGIFVHPHQFSTTSLAASWTYSDEESGVAGFVWSATRASNGDVVVPPTWLGGDDRAVAEGLSLVHGEAYDIELTVCNKALQCSTDTATVTVDTTAPSAGALFIGEYATATIDALCAVPPNSNSQEVVCTSPPQALLPGDGLDAAGPVSWGGFDDGHSPIVQYTVALGTSALGSQLGDPVVFDASVHSTPLSTLAFSDDATVEARLYDGLSLWVSVTATNNAGLSASVTVPLLAVDRQTPTAGMVSFVGSLSVPISDSGTTTDAAVGSYGRQHVVQNTTSDATVTWTPFVEFGAAETAPNASVVYVAQLLTAESLDEVAWHTVADDNVTVHSGAVSVSWDGLNLVPGRAYVAAVTAFDYGGNSITAYSQTRLVVDATPPVQLVSPPVAGVRDGLSAFQDLDCQARSGTDPASPSTVVTIDARSGSPSIVAELPELVQVTGDAETDVVSPPFAATVLQFTFDPFMDPESGVATTRVAVGSAPGRSDLMAWTTLPLAATSAQVLLPTLPEGVVAYVGVDAENAVSLHKSAWSDGVRLLCQPGTVGCDYDGTFLCLA